MTIEPNMKIRRNPRATTRRLENGSAVLLHLDTAQYHGLNEVGAAIWDLAEDQTVAEITEALEAQLEDPPPHLEQEVEAFLEALAERQLISFVPAGPQT